MAKLHWDAMEATRPHYPAMRESINDSEELKVETSEQRQDDKGCCCGVLIGVSASAFLLGLLFGRTERQF